MIQNNQEQEVVIDLMAVLRALWKKAYVIVLCGLIFGILAYAGVYFFVTPQYSASVTLYVNNASSKESSTSVTLSDLNASAQLVDTYAAILSSNSMLEQVIVEADVDMEAEDLAEQLTTSAVNSTEVFQVSVMNPDPKAAARIANAIAEIAPERISGIVDGSSVKVIDYAKIPTKITEPSYRKSAAIGVFLGFLLSAALIVLKEIMDTSIKSESDLEGWGLPILGTVPDFAEARKSKTYGYGYGHSKAEDKG